MGKRYGQWEVVKSLDEGGQGHVFLVRNVVRKTASQFVLKRLKNVDNPVRRQRFEREVAVTKSLSHPNILRIIDEDLHNQQPYYVAEYCEGGSLGDGKNLESLRGNIAKTANALLPIVDALVTAHKAGIVHRDVKPPNILFRKDGTPVMGDFGICFTEQGTLLTLSDEAMGALNFVAPEMESGMHGEPTDRTDVYSLGKVLYWTLSGGRIFGREDHRRNSLVDLLNDQRFEHVHMPLDRMIVEQPSGRLSSDEIKEELLMVESLVSGNYAPLRPSIGIKCRFCGIGSYQRYATSRNPDNPAGYHDGKMKNELGWEPTGVSDVRVLRCSHGGHIEAFQFDGIKARDWWKK